MGVVELWAEYGVASLFIIVRFLVRLKMLGIRNFTVEDVLMMAALILLTLVTAFIDRITAFGVTIGQTPESVWLLTPDEIAGMVIGQKLSFAVWMVYLTYSWTLKATLLVMFRRLTHGLGWQVKMLNIITVYVAIAYIGAMLTHILVCLPIHKSWQVQPYPGDSCATRNLNYYLITYFNASADFGIMLVPIPIIFTAKIPIWRRFLLALLLCSGGFAVVAIILRAYFSLQDLNTLPIAADWTSRETMVAAFVVSLPGIKPIFSQKTWFTSSSSHEGKSGEAGYSGNKKGSSGGKGWGHELRTIGGSRRNELMTIGGSRRPAGPGVGGQGPNDWRSRGKALRGDRISSDGESEDIILNQEDHSGREGVDNSINVKTEYIVTTEEETKAQHAF